VGPPPSAETIGITMWKSALARAAAIAALGRLLLTDRQASEVQEGSGMERSSIQHSPLGKLLNRSAVRIPARRCKRIFTGGVISRRRPPSSGSPRPCAFAGARTPRVGVSTLRGGGRVDQSAGLRSPVALMNVHRRSEDKRAIPPRSTSTGAATSLSAGKIVTRRRLRREWRYWRCVTRSRPRRFRNGS
jgi:hypothetical protein